MHLSQAEQVALQWSSKRRPIHVTPCEERQLLQQRIRRIRIELNADPCSHVIGELKKLFPRRNRQQHCIGSLLDDTDGVGERLNRATEIQRADDDQGSFGALPERSAPERHQRQQAKRRAGSIVVHGPELYRGYCQVQWERGRLGR